MDSDHQPPLASSARANYIQGGDADVLYAAWLCTTLLGVVIHMCCQHAAPMQAQVHFSRIARHSDLPSVNSRRWCLSCCRSINVEPVSLKADRTTAQSWEHAVDSCAVVVANNRPACSRQDLVN